MRKKLTPIIAGIIGFPVSQLWVSNVLFALARGTASVFGRTHSLLSWSLWMGALAGAVAFFIVRRAIVGTRSYGVSLLLIALLGLVLVANAHGWALSEGAVNWVAFAIVLSFSASWLVTLYVVELG